MANNLSRKEIENIYNSTPAPSNGMSRDEIANIYNSYTPEIPKLEQNTTPTPTTDYRAEIERMNKLKADTTAPRTEGENQAIDTYLNSLTDAQRYLDSQKPVSTTTKSGTKVKKQPIGTVEIKADGTKKFTKTMSANEKKEYENRLLDQAKVIGKQAKENAQPKERALSANEQRDLERALTAATQAQEKEREKNSLPNRLKSMAEPFTHLPKKERKYDDRGFEINPSITDNQSIVDEFLDPNKKLSQADEKKAKQLIREYEESDLGQKNENATTLVFDNEHPDGMAVPSYAVDENGVYHPYLELTPEERQYQQSIGALKTKVKDSESFLVGAMQTVPFVDALQRAGDENGEYARMVANSQKQNPLSYWGGLLGTGVAMNAAGQFALNGTKYGDLINRIAGVDKVGISNRSKAIRRTLAEAAMDVPVDLATDIIPTLSSDLAQDKSAGEVIGNTAFNIGLNGLLNLAPAAISNWSDIRPNGIPEVWLPQKKATQNAVENVVPIVDDIVPQEAKVVEEIKKAIDDIPEVVENPVVENIPTNNNGIVSLNPDLDSELDTAVRNTVERNSAIDVKSVKVANKQLDNNINSLANMFGKNKNNEGVVALKEALNEYAETGSEEALNRARTIANNMDGYYSGATYKSRKGNITDFGNGTQGTFTSQVDDFADKLRAGATIQGTPLHVTDLDKRINDLFSKYDLTADDAESVRAWKQAINDYMANPTDDSWNILLDASSDVARRSSNMSEFVSSYKGKAKSNPFDMDELVDIMDEIDTRRPMKNAPSVPDVEAPVNANNIPPTNNVPPTPNNPVPPIPEGNGELVERGASRHIRSVNDVTEYTPMKYDVPDEVSNEFIDNPDMYRQLKNVDTQARADAIYERGGDVETIFRRMLAQKDPASLALGHRIAKDYSANKQFEKAAQIYRDMGAELTKAGQFSQASVLAMMKNDPLTALYYAQKEIDALNTSGAKRFGKKWKDFELTPEEVKAFGRIEPGDEKAIAQLYDQVGARLGKEYPTTVTDKLLEARRVSMLFNLRTNIRNFGANIPTLAMRWVSDRVDSLGQHFVHLLDPDFEVTNSIKGAGFRGRKLANEVYNSDAVQAMLKGTNGKYSPDITNSLMQNKQVFKGTPVSRWINKVTNGGIEKVNKKLFGKEGVESGLETVRNATYKALELGDTPFVRENFVERLGSYINAKGIKNINDIPDDAIQVAWEEAMKATYKDNSWAVQMLRGIKNGMESIPGVGRPISQAVIPFLQAPGNIAARMVDYSPIKATKGIVDMISGANSGNLNAVRKGIEEFSKGATGTGMIILGMKLKESGLITGDYSEDKDQRNFEKQHGFKPYALHIGDKYFTYDWAQPFAEPMIIGTLLQEAIDNSDQYDSEILKYFGHEGTTAGKIIGGLKEGASASVNSWFNASPLQGLADLMKSDYSGDSSIAENIYDKTVVDFASSFIPSLVNSAAKTADPIMRNTYDPSNAFGTFLNEQVAKLPGLSDNLPAKYDTWGNELKYADSKGESFARKFVIPGDYGKDSDDPVDQEINALFDATSDNRVFPLTAPNSVDGVKLNNREVSEYQQDMGQRSREIVENLMDSDYYDDLSESNKVETLNTVYAVSKAITERDLFDKPVADNSTYKKAVEAYDEGGAEGLMSYLQGKALVSNSGVGTTSKAANSIQELINSGDKEGAKQLADDISYLSENGLSTKAQGAYASRGSRNFDADTYASMYSQIDISENDGEGNGKISQKELIPYLEEQRKQGKIKNDQDALKIWEGFLTDYEPGENKIPVWDKETGTYKTVKPGDDFETTIPTIEEDTEEAPGKLSRPNIGVKTSQNVPTQDEEWDRATLSSDPYVAISQSGVGHGNQYIDQAWDKAVLANSSLTPQEFIDTWAAIDSSGNGKHTKDEFKAYLNDNSIDQEEGNMILDMYYPSNWKRPTYKKGKWS